MIKFGYLCHFWGTFGAHFIENACSFVVCMSIFIVALCRIATAAWFCAFPFVKAAFSAVCADVGVEHPLIANIETLGLVQLHPFSLCFLPLC